MWNQVQVGRAREAGGKGLVVGRRFGKLGEMGGEGGEEERQREMRGKPPLLLLLILGAAEASGAFLGALVS